MQRRPFPLLCVHAGYAGPDCSQCDPILFSIEAPAWGEGAYKCSPTGPTTRSQQSLGRRSTVSGSIWPFLTPLLISAFTSCVLLICTVVAVWHFREGNMRKLALRRNRAQQEQSYAPLTPQPSFESPCKVAIETSDDQRGSMMPAGPPPTSSEAATPPNAGDNAVWPNDVASSAVGPSDVRTPSIETPSRTTSGRDRRGSLLQPGDPRQIGSGTINALYIGGRGRLHTGYPER
jgi:hypothetical protein